MSPLVDVLRTKSHCGLCLIPPALSMLCRVLLDTCGASQHWGLNRRESSSGILSVSAWNMEWHRMFLKPWQDAMHAKDVRLVSACHFFITGQCIELRLEVLIESATWNTTVIYFCPFICRLTIWIGNHTGGKKVNIMINDIKVIVASRNNLAVNNVFVKRVPCMPWIKTISQMKGIEDIVCIYVKSPNHS